VRSPAIGPCSRCSGATGPEVVPGNRLTWLGHSTALLEIGGSRLITDPMLRPRVAHLRRHAPAPTPPGRLDAILLSHLHRDHLDVRSVRALDAEAPLLVPPGAAAAVRRLGREVRELAPGATTEIGAVRVRATPAIHDGRRSPASRTATSIGFLVDSVYFAGDTEVFGAMAELAGHVDTALLPVSGWGPKLGPGHMDPEQAAQAVALLRPRLAIPIHWGTYLRLGLGGRHVHLLRRPGPEFAARVAQTAPGTRVAVLQPGESIDVP
jgi:L-ascorbate metabolism protein UlaG (beta-lactamase superfamily)